MKNKGFTLIEIIAALGVMAVLAGIVLVSVAVVPQYRTKKYAEAFLSRTEEARDIARTHGGDVAVTVRRDDNQDLYVEYTSASSSDVSEKIGNYATSVYYKLTGDDNIYELGVSGGRTELCFSYTQTRGSMIGPDLLDYMILGDSADNYKFVFNQTTGNIVYDYEADENFQNETNNATVTVDFPTFTDEAGNPVTGDVELQYTEENGAPKSQQPDFTYNSAYVKVSGAYRAIYAGTYEITFSLKDPYSSTWSDGSTADYTLTWKITR